MNDKMRLPNRVAILSFYIIIFVVLMVPGLSAAFELESMFPTFETKVAFTTDELTLVFDASLDPNTVTDASFLVTEQGSSANVSGTIALYSTNLANDTIVFTPDGTWTWGLRYKVVLTSQIKDMSGGPFTGILPDSGLFAANIPNDFNVPVWDPSDPRSIFISTLDLLGYNPLDPENPADPWQIPGSHFTDAWKYSTGRPDVIIAILDTGINPDDSDIRRALFLNQMELPLPNISGAPCSEYDCNGDGLFDVDDYAEDDRLTLTGPVTAADMVEAFSNGVDDDANGFVDDISGWDFYRNTNQPWCTGGIPTGCHGSGMASLAVSRGNNGYGNRVGGCPECTVLPLRTSPMVMHGGGEIEAAVRYAEMMGASVISLSAVSLAWSADGTDAITEAKEQGVVTVAVSGDEMTYHHWMPGCAENVLTVKSIFPLVPIDLVAGLNLDMIGFTETPATNYGPHVHLSVPANTYSTSESTALTAGAIGLVQSRGKELGLDLTADEVKQILTMTADDIADHCASASALFNVCQEGFDERFGYGRMNLEHAMEVMGDPDRGIGPMIPPSVQIQEPLWWQTIDPKKTPVIEVLGNISSRVIPYTWELQIAKGQQPLELEFVTVATGQESGVLIGRIASLPVAQYISEQWASRRPVNQNTFEVTVRLLASYQSGMGTPVFGEDRKTISVHIDDDEETGLVAGFPKDIGAAGDSAPILYDMDGDEKGDLEIVLGDATGKVHILKYNDQEGELGELPGFPVDFSNDGQLRNAVFGDVAVGDIFNDGTPEIVAATREGFVYAIDLEGEILSGFPVMADPPTNDSSLTYGFGNGFMAAPVLSDLDLDGLLDIIAVSMDQKVYAWTLKGNKNLPERIPGWPVTCRSDAGVVPDELVCDYPDYAIPIIATPAVGILDPESSNEDISLHPSVIIASNESCHDTTRTYAIFHNGNENPEGPFLPGWPATPKAPLSNLIGRLPIIAGNSASPAVYLDEQGAHIFNGVTAWFPQIIHYKDDQTHIRSLVSKLAVSAVGSPSVSDMEGSGELQIVIPMVGLLRFDELGFQLVDPVLNGFNLSGLRKNFVSKKIEDIPFLTSVSVADLDGNGTKEALAGTGGYLVHALNTDGSEPTGWPKYTHKWMATAPAVGDLDGDDRIEIVAISRTGMLYAWNALGQACVDDSLNSDWRRSHGNERNTGLYGADTLPPGIIPDLTVESIDRNRIRLTFTAPGDDWYCGQSESYDIRFTTGGDDLSDPAVFENADRLGGIQNPRQGGMKESFVLDTEGAEKVAIRSIDEAGNLSRISVAQVQPPSQDDDDNNDDTDGDDNDNDDTDGDDDDNDVGQHSSGEDDDESCGCAG